MVAILTFIIFLAFDLLRPAITTLLSKIAGENQGFIGGMNFLYKSREYNRPATGGILLNVNVNLPYIFAGLILAIGFGITVYWSKYITKTTEIHFQCNPNLIDRFLFKPKPESLRFI